MSVISGIGGLASSGGTSIGALRTWQIASHKANLQEMFHSCTKGASEQSTGNKDWNGNYTGYGGLPVVLPGEALTFLGSIEGTVGATGTAIVDSVEITVDIEGGKPIEHVVNFSSNGALTFGAAVCADPATVVIPATSIGCKVELGTIVAVPVFTEVTDIRNWKLTLTRNNLPYASSSTAGLMKRVKGNLTAAVSYSCYTGAFSTLPAVGTQSAIRLYTSATLFWLLNWVNFGELSGLLVDREAAALVGATVNASLDIVADVAATVTVGTILKPGGAAYFP